MKIENKEQTLLGLHTNFEHDPSMYECAQRSQKRRAHRSQKHRVHDHLTKNVQQAGAELCQAELS